MYYYVSYSYQFIAQKNENNNLFFNNLDRYVKNSHIVTLIYISNPNNYDTT